MKIAGVDDAGRGSVIGPPVVAGVVIEEEKLTKLRDLGVKDSKLLSAHRRERLKQEIKKLVLQFHIVELSPAEIDQVVEKKKKLHKLNRLEANTMAEVIKILKPDIAYVDASDVIAERFKEHIRERLSFEVEIVSEHKADATYPIVSAASIIAKVKRDIAVNELIKKYGDMGAGYPSDPRTIRFLENWITHHGSYPDFVRKSWKPAKKLILEAKAKKITLI